MRGRRVVYVRGRKLGGRESERLRRVREKELKRDGGQGKGRGKNETSYKKTERGTVEQRKYGSRLTSYTEYFQMTHTPHTHTHTHTHPHTHHTHTHAHKHYTPPYVYIVYHSPS
jgi:hypothetical protein